MKTLELTDDQAESLLNIVEAAVLDGHGDDELMLVYDALNRMMEDEG